MRMSSSVSIHYCAITFLVPMICKFLSFCSFYFLNNRTDDWESRPSVGPIWTMRIFRAKYCSNSATPVEVYNFWEIVMVKVLLFD